MCTKTRGSSVFFHQRRSPSSYTRLYLEAAASSSANDEVEVLMASSRTRAGSKERREAATFQKRLIFEADLWMSSFSRSVCTLVNSSPDPTLSDRKSIIKTKQKLRKISPIYNDSLLPSRGRFYYFASLATTIFSSFCPPAATASLAASQPREPSLL